jgi:hypothetical protein
MAGLSSATRMIFAMVRGVKGNMRLVNVSIPY